MNRAFVRHMQHVGADHFRELRAGEVAGAADA